MNYFDKTGSFFDKPPCILRIAYGKKSEELYGVGPWPHNVGVVSFEGSLYVAFDDKGLYYDVTTEENRRELGIEMVDSIVG